MSEVVVNTYDTENSATLFEHKPAGFWIRFVAYLIDLSLINIVLIGLIVNNVLLATKLENYTFMYLSWSTIIGFIVFYIYFILMTKFLGQTIGKMIVGLKVVRDNGENLNWSTVLFREGIGRLFSAILYLPYLIIPFTSKHKGLHDFIADTHVVHEESFSKKGKSNSKNKEKSLKERYGAKEKQENEPSQLQDKENL